MFQVYITLILNTIFDSVRSLNSLSSTLSGYSSNSRQLGWTVDILNTKFLLVLNHISFELMEHTEHNTSIQMK